MTQPDLPYEPPQVEVAPPRKGFRPICILYGCGGALVLMLLLLGSCVLMVKGAMSAGEREFAPAAEGYLAKVAVGDYHGAYLEFGENLRRAVKEEDYIALDAGIHDRLGRLQSKTLQGVQTGADMQGRWGRLVYQGTFEKGRGTIRMEFRKEAELWKLEGVYYDSPLLVDALRRPSTKAE